MSADCWIAAHPANVGLPLSAECGYGAAPPASGRDLCSASRAAVTAPGHRWSRNRAESLHLREHECESRREHRDAPARRQRCASPRPRRSGVVIGHTGCPLRRGCGSRRCACCRPNPRRVQAHLALARVGEQSSSSTPTSLPVRTISTSDPASCPSGCPFGRQSGSRLCPTVALAHRLSSHVCKRRGRTSAGWGPAVAGSNPVSPI